MTSTIQKDQSDFLESLRVRHPNHHDAASIWRMVEDSRTLDHNSFYCYFVLCHYFRLTCAVAEFNKDVVGFVTGFRPPEQLDTLFVWQIRTRKDMRGRGLAKKLVRFVLDSSNGTGIRHLAATISPSNIASRTLFESLARSFNAEIVERLDLLPVYMFPKEVGLHEEEHLFTIGPITPPI